MDLQEQLKKLFPDHEPSNEPEAIAENNHELFIQKEPMICKYEKRKGKATTIIEGYEGSDDDFKILAKSAASSLVKLPEMEERPFGISLCTTGDE